MIKSKFLIIITLGLLFIAFSSCNAGDPLIHPVDEGYEAPAVPNEINDYNLFTIEFYSNLKDEKLLTTSNYEAVVNRINSEKKSLYFFFDRADIRIGESSPIVDIAWKTKTNSFFVQNKREKDNTIEGTGIITRQLLNVFPGMCVSPDFFVAGCNVSIPLYQSTRSSLLTCKLTSKNQFESLVKTEIKDTESNKIIIGTIARDLEDDFRNFLKYNLKDFRISITASKQTDKDYKLFVLSPVDFVVREISEVSIANLPLFQCKIEHLK